MITSKTRMQGSSVVITLPPSNGEKPTPNTEYIVEYSNDGTIILVPKMDDPFNVEEIGVFYETDE